MKEIYQTEFNGKKWRIRARSDGNAVTSSTEKLEGNEWVDCSITEHYELHNMFVGDTIEKLCKEQEKNNEVK